MIATEYIKHLTAWLHIHPNWGGFIAFSVAFSESIAVIGSLLPGSVTMTAIGAMIGTGVLPITLTFACAISGAILGDLFSYGLGHYYKHLIPQIWPFKKYPMMLEKGEKFFYKHGGKSIFIGRFVGPVRSILPLVAGMLKMPAKNFLVADVVSAFAWAPAYMLPGMLIGAASLELAPDTATRLILMTLLSLIFISLLSWLIKLTSTWVISVIDNVFQRFWGYLDSHHQYKIFTYAIHDPRDPNGHGQLMLAVSFLLGISLYFLFCILVYNHTSIIRFNLPSFYFLESIRNHIFDPIILGVTLFGEKKVLALMITCVFIWLLYSKHYRTAYYWLLNVVFAEIFVWLTKNIVHFPRPLGVFKVHSTYSFPSGHTTLAIAAYGYLSILIATQLNKTQRIYFLPAPLLLIIAIGISRLYLGVHWLSDVIGGLLLGSCSLMLFTLAYRRKHVEKINALHLFTVAAISLLVSWSLYSRFNFNIQSKNYQPIVSQHVIEANQWWQQQRPILPYFRLGRTGKPREALNVQWLASLDTIRKDLAAQGWQEVTKKNVYEIINSIAAKDKAQHLPLFHKLHKNKQPSLIMIKNINSEKPILILRLWPSEFILDKDKQAIWVGTVAYRITWHHQWVPQHKKLLPQLTPPLSMLIKDLGSIWQRRSLSYPLDKSAQQFYLKENVRILLLREN